MELTQKLLPYCDVNEKVLKLQWVISFQIFLAMLLPSIIWIGLQLGDYYKNKRVKFLLRHSIRQSDKTCEQRKTISTRRQEREPSVLISGRKGDYDFSGTAWCMLFMIINAFVHQIIDNRW